MDDLKLDWNALGRMTPEELEAEVVRLGRVYAKYCAVHEEGQRRDIVAYQAAVASGNQPRNLIMSPELLRENNNMLTAMSNVTKVARYLTPAE